MIQFDEHIFQTGWNHQLVYIIFFMGRRCRDCFIIYLVVHSKSCSNVLRAFSFGFFFAIGSNFCLVFRNGQRNGSFTDGMCVILSLPFCRPEFPTGGTGIWKAGAMADGWFGPWGANFLKFPMFSGTSKKQLQVGDFQEKLCQKVEENSPQVFEASCVVFNYIIKVLRTNYHDHE